MKKESVDYIPEGNFTIQDIKEWVDSLLVSLMEHKDDKEFVMDLLESSGRNFTNSFSDIDKENVFMYILGTLARAKGIK
jgi:hypothetical protein